MHEDVKRLGERFHEVFQTFGPASMAKLTWEEVPFEYKLQLLRTLDELVKSEVVFPGPSLYADP